MAIDERCTALAGHTPVGTRRDRTFHTLDALRGVAALAVLLFHAAFFYDVKAPPEGQIAVDLFFVMSGFIIAYRYDVDLRAGLPVRSFLAVRLVRLYPLYLLGAVLGFLPAALAVVAGNDDWFHHGLVASFPLHVLMLPSWFVAPRIEEIYPLNYVSWSLVLEILVNVAYAATFRFWTIPRLVALVCAASAGLLFCAIAYGSLIGGFAWTNVPVGFVRILYSFPTGVLLYRLFERKPFTWFLPWWLPIIAAVAIFYVDVSWARPFWQLLFITIFVPLIVAAAAANEPPSSLRSSCSWAGVFSYVVYSLHAPFIGLFMRAEERLHVDLQTQSVGKAILFTICLAGLCLAAHFAFDKPVRRWLSSDRSRRRMRLATSANS